MLNHGPDLNSSSSSGYEGYSLSLTDEQAAHFQDNNKPQWITQRNIPGFLLEDAQKAKEILPHLQELEKQLAITARNEQKPIRAELQKLKAQMPQYWVDQHGFHSWENKISGPIWLNRPLAGYSDTDQYILELSFYPDKNSSIRSR